MKHPDYKSLLFHGVVLSLIAGWLSCSITPQRHNKKFTEETMTQLIRDSIPIDSPPEKVKKFLEDNGFDYTPLVQDTVTGYTDEVEHPADGWRRLMMTFYFIDGKLSDYKVEYAYTGL